MNYNIVNTDKIDISDDLNLQIYNVEPNNHKIIVIDNFLKNPEYLVGITKNVLFEKPTDDEITGGGGWHTETYLRFTKIKKICCYLAETYYGLDGFLPDNNHIRTQFNLLEGGSECDSTSIIPHIDQSYLAFTLYLNHDEDCKTMIGLDGSIGEFEKSGTVFYRHKETGLDHNLQYLDKTFKRSEHYWKLYEQQRKDKKNSHKTIYDSTKIDENIWEKSFTIGMKFNRFVFYPSYMFHTAYLEEDWFKKTKRITLSGFVGFV